MQVMIEERDKRTRDRAACAEHQECCDKHPDCVQMQIWKKQGMDRPNPSI
jgi:hypothetical protein